jgi:hypothetical protein
MQNKKDHSWRSSLFNQIKQFLKSVGALSSELMVMELPNNKTCTAKPLT